MKATYSPEDDCLRLHPSVARPARWPVTRVAKWTPWREDTAQRAAGGVIGDEDIPDAVARWHDDAYWLERSYVPPVCDDRRERLIDKLTVQLKAETESIHPDPRVVQHLQRLIAYHKRSLSPAWVPLLNPSLQDAFMLQQYLNSLRREGDRHYKAVVFAEDSTALEPIVVGSFRVRMFKTNRVAHIKSLPTHEIRI